MAYTVKAGDTLSKLYGSNWQQLSGYTGDPTKLQVGAQLNDLPGQAKQAAATSVSANPVSKPPINIFANTAPYSTGGTPINPTTLPNTSGVYNNAQGTGSTRVIGGAGVPSNLPGQPAQTGFLGAVNNFGKTIGAGIDSMFGTNYAGANSPQVAQTAQNNQNTQTNKKTGNTYQTSGSQTQTPSIPTYIPPADPNAAQKAALQAQIDALQSKVNNAQSQGATSTTQLDDNGNPIQDTGGTQNQSSYINNLANTENPTTYQQVVNSLANFQNPQYNTAVQNLQNLQTEAASAQAGTENVAGGAPITASDQAGQAGILNRLYASKIQAAQTGVSNTLQAGQQQLSGLQSAQGALQPQLSQYGNTYYFPGSATGNATQTGGAGVSTSDPFYATLQSYAQMAANGQYSAIPSSITGNSVLNAQMNQMAKQINQNYNPITSQAQSGITASQAGNVATMTASYKSATNLGNQLKDLITTFGINPADINSVNSGIQKIAQNVSSPQYKALFNLVTDIVSTYSSILTPGSTSNQAQDKAASLLDASAKGSSIMETLNNLDEQAKAKIAGQTTSYGENPGNTNSSGSTSSTGNSWNDIFGNQ